MRRPKWHVFSNLLIIALIVVGIYAGGFLLLRMQFVELATKYDGTLIYHCQSLAMKPNGPIGFAIDFYKPAFLLEMKFHEGNLIIINGWSSGMRMWQITPQSGP